MEVGGLQVGEVTRLGGVKQYAAPLHAMLQPRHPRVHYLSRKMLAKQVFWRLMLFYTHLLLLLRPSVL